MSNGIKFVFLLSVILIAMFSLTFAQDVPFNAEVIVDTARMRWGPGPAYTVQHYANLGHILTVLEADTESDPPWTWYRARTPSGVESWIRGDLLRRATGAAAQVEMPTGTYPVVENNLCNTDIYRRCQDGTDHDLWQSGYWANNRYNHWESGGWDLDIVYHNNPCKSNRLCTTRAQWDAGLIEAQNFAASLTPEATWTPVVIERTVEVGVRELWEAVTVTGSTITLGGVSVDLYSPLVELAPAGSDRWPFGGFRISSEQFYVDCHHWYRTANEALVKRAGKRVNLDKLPTDPATDGDSEDESNVRCLTNIGDDQVVARQWEMTLNRRYGNFAGISGVTWQLTATYGSSEPEDTCTSTAKCTPLLSADTTVRGRLSGYTGAQPTAAAPARPGFRLARDLFLGATVTGQECSGRIREEGEGANRRWRHEYTCIDDDGDLQHKLTFNFTYTEDRYARPTAEPE